MKQKKARFAAAGMGLCLGEKEIYCIRAGKEISSKDLIREAKKSAAVLIRWVL